MEYTEVGKIPFDDDGFLVGIHHIEQKFSDIEKDIAEILLILRSTKSFDFVDKESNVPFKNSLKDSQKKVIDGIELLSEQQKEIISEIKDFSFEDGSYQSTENKNSETSNDGEHERSSRTANRERDSKGRFKGNRTDEENDSDNENGQYIKSIIGKLGDGIGLLKSSFPDTRGVDPTLDAVNELNDSLSPVKRMANTVLRPLSGLMRSRKRSEPLPREQVRHNNRVLSYLQQIAKQSGNTLSLFGLVRTVPMIAVAIGSAVTLGLVSWWKGGGFNGIRKGTVNGSEASAGLARINPSQDQKSTIKDSYDSAIKAGFSHDQAIALIGENGRENDFNQNLMYGSHNDPARGKNLGIFSWQGKRREGLIKYLSSKGLMNPDGTIVRSKAGLQAQYEYARLEMQQNPKWKQAFLDKKNIQNDEARKALGGVGSYVGWARGQDNIRKADGTLVPFDWKAQEAKANSYSKTASAISDTKAEKDDSIIQQNVKVTKPSSRNPMANRIQREAYEKANSDQSKQAVNVPVQGNNNQNTGNRRLFYAGVSKLPTNETAIGKSNSKSPKPVIISNNDPSSLISQNVGDLNLANIFSGGIGMNKNSVK